MKYLGSSGLTRLVELINERFATKTELNGKANSTHEHSYAGSSMAGGAATSANKINTDAGSATQPVYFDDGVPVATTYALNATVPAGAKFTDTTYENATTSEAGLMSAADKTIVNGIATTYAPLSSPVFTGTPVAPTPTTGDDSTKIATTAFVNDAISNIPSSTEWDDIVNKPSTFEPATHTHNYAASNTAGGSALSAEKINANAGSPSQPIYFDNGIPVATTYALNKTVPADAVFTDTTIGSGITLTGYSKPNATSAIAATDTVNQAIGKLEKSLETINTNVSNAATTSQLEELLASPELTGTPTAPTASAGTNTTQVATTAFVQSAVSGLVDSAPQTLDTLNELASALGNDPNFATTIATQIGGKVSTDSADYIKSASVSGKTLTLTKGNNTTVTFTETDTTYSAATQSEAGLMSAADKTKLDGIAEGANNYTYTHPNTVTAGTVGTSSATSGITLEVPYVTYNANGHITATGTHTHTVTGFLTSDSTLNAAKLSGTIPATCYTDTTYSVATTSSDGLMSASDKTTLNGISTTYVAQTSVGNAANKIPVYSAEGHLVLPNGIEIY